MQSRQTLTPILFHFLEIMAYTRSKIIHFPVISCSQHHFNYHQKKRKRMAFPLTQGSSTVQYTDAHIHCRDTCTHNNACQMKHSSSSLIEYPTNNSPSWSLIQKINWPLKLQMWQFMKQSSRPFQVYKHIYFL